MELSESSKIFLENYYLLEQARTEAHIYLERIVTEMANQVREYLKEKDDGVIHFNTYIQKGGGLASFIFERKEPIQKLDSIDRWKFSIEYLDCMRSEKISSPTKCKVFCNSPKSHGKQIFELNRMASKLGLPSLFRQVEIEMLDASEDEVVSAVKSQVIEFYDQFIEVVAGLMNEVKLPD